MPSYEQRINNFAEGKHLLRLARSIRNRADALCDACGSAQPRTLYALADLETERHFFVGESCLKELAKRGVIQRRFGRESGQQAYETEMKLRVLQRLGSANLEANRTDPGAATSKPKPSAGEHQAPKAVDGRPSSPIVLIFETSEYYQAFVAIARAGGGAVYSGSASEPRYEEFWRTGGERGMVLEKAKRERLDAATLCLTRAWEEAYSQLSGREAVPAENHPDGNSVAQPIALLRLGATPPGTPPIGT